MVPKKSQFSPKVPNLPLWSFFEEGPKFQILYWSACLSPNVYDFTKIFFFHEYF